VKGPHWGRWGEGEKGSRGDREKNRGAEMKPGVDRFPFSIFYFLFSIEEIHSIAIWQYQNDKIKIANKK
jgi:hypothetical protein